MNYIHIFWENYEFVLRDHVPYLETMTLNTLTVDTAARLRVPVPFSLIIVFCVVCFAMVPIFARPLMEAGFSGDETALLRFLPGLLVFLWCLKRLYLQPYKWAAMAVFAGCGAGIGGAWALYFEALQVIPVAVAGTLYMSYPLFVTLFAWVGYRARPGSPAVLSAIMVLAGAGTMTFGGPLPDSDGWAAILMVLPAPIVFAVMVVLISRDYGRLSFIEKFAATNGGTMLFLLPTTLPGLDVSMVLALDPSIIAVALLFSISTAVVPQLLFTWAAPKLSESRVATLGALELPIMVLAGWIFFYEVLGLKEMIAVALIFGAVGLVSRKKR